MHGSDMCARRWLSRNRSTTAPLLVVATVAAHEADGVDAATLSFLAAHALVDMRKEEEEMKKDEEKKRSRRSSRSRRTPRQACGFPPRMPVAGPTTDQYGRLNRMQ